MNSRIKTPASGCYILITFSDGSHNRASGSTAVAHNTENLAIESLQR